MSADVIACVDPRSGELLGQVPVMDVGQVEHAVRVARARQATWGVSKVRRRVARAVLAAVVEGQDELCRVAGHESGKSLLEITVGELVPTCEVLRYAASRRSTAPPCGVVAVIGSGRAPLLEVLAASMPALVEGNAVAIKLSEHTSWSGLALVELLRDALREHRCSADVVQAITGYDDTADALAALADDVVDPSASASPTAPLLPALDGNDHTYALVEALVRLGYTRGIRRRARALVDTLGVVSTQARRLAVRVGSR